jgi:putative sensory transduction regulator
MDTSCLAMAVSAMLCSAQLSPTDYVSGFEPMSIIRHLEQEGYRAKLAKDDEGDPIIESATGGSDFTITFDDCNERRLCESLTFSIAYRFEGTNDASLETINRWNANERFGQAYLDQKGNTALDMSVLMFEGMLPRKAFQVNFDKWESTLGEFEHHIGWIKN